MFKQWLQHKIVKAIADSDPKKDEMDKSIKEKAMETYNNLDPQFKKRYAETFRMIGIELED